MPLVKTSLIACFLYIPRSSAYVVRLGPIMFANRNFMVCMLCCRALLTVSDYRYEARLRGYKTFLMLNLAEHDIFSANKYENANNINTASFHGE